MADIPCLLELELCSPWFDASAPLLAAAEPDDGGLAVRAANPEAGPPQLLLLLAPPRSGSHHLSRLLWLHGYGRPLEYLNPHLRQPLARFSPGWPQPARGVRALARGVRRRLAPDRRPLGWWQRLVAERSTLSCHSGRPFFAIKLQRGQCGTDAATLRRTFEPLARQGLWPTFEQSPPAVIGLFRSNWQRAVVSHHLALCTGAFDQGRIVSFQHRPISCLGRPDALAEDLAAYRLQLDWLLACVEQSGFPARVIEHEALVRDQEAVLAALIRSIDAGAPSGDALRRNGSLALRIAREHSAWVSHREAWLDHLQQAFLAAGLDRHPDAVQAQALVERLQARAGDQIR